MAHTMMEVESQEEGDRLIRCVGETLDGDVFYSGAPYHPGQADDTVRLELYEAQSAAKKQDSMS